MLEVGSNFNYVSGSVGRRLAECKIVPSSTQKFSSLKMLLFFILNPFVCLKSLHEGLSRMEYYGLSIGLIK